MGIMWNYQAVNSVTCEIEIESFRKEVYVAIVRVRVYTVSISFISCCIVHRSQGLNVLLWQCYDLANENQPK